MKTLISAVVLALALVGCSGDKVSFQTQEDARTQARSNAEYNAKSWRNKNQPNGKILMRGDSTIGPNCAQGDGWATVDIEEGNTFTELKCSTVSGTIGCMTTMDFKQRDSYADQDGSCNNDIPFPLPKIAK